MKIDIEVTRGTARRVAMVGGLLIALGTAAAVYASQVTFTSGTTLTAADLNNNFNELYAKAAKPAVTKGARSISAAGSFCGVSSGTYMGTQIGGYPGAKTQCETACSSPTAHLCTVEDIDRTWQLGVSTTFTGTDAFMSDPVGSSDCDGWTSVTGTARLLTSGALKMGTTGSVCGTAYPVACCD